MILKDFKVTSLGLDNDRIDLLWDYTKPEDALDYEVWVERAGALSGPFSPVGRTYNAVSFTDRSADYDITERSFYRLRVVKRSDLTTLELSETKVYEPEPNLIVREIQLRQNLVQREHSGVPVLYYPTRTTGVRCPDCYDEGVGQQIRSQCESCFDTTYITGYYTPILMYMQIHEDQTALVQNPETDEVPVRTATARITGDIRLQFADLVLESSNERWLVSSWDRTELQRARVSYNARLHHVLETDVRYRVPLPETDIFEKFEKSREYTRPYTLNP